MEGREERRIEAVRENAADEGKADGKDDGREDTEIEKRGRRG